MRAMANLGQARVLEITDKVRRLVLSGARYDEWKIFEKNLAECWYIRESAQ